MNSVWTVDRTSAAPLPPLTGELDAEIAIIGGGVTGLATAAILSDAGARVVLLEARKLGMGSTGGSTGNLYSTISKHLSSLASKWDLDTISQVVSVRCRALDNIQRNVERWGINCDFARRPLYLGAVGRNEGPARQLEEEYKLARSAGLDCQLLDNPVGLGLPFSKVLRIEDQAQFNPLLYCDGLTRALIHGGVKIFEESPATSIDAAAGTVVTPQGKVRADQIVIATHTPKGINLLQAEMEPCREHGVALPLQDNELAEPGIYWSLDDSISLRSHHSGGKDYLIVVGGKYKTGVEQGGESFWGGLEQYGRRYFRTGEPSHRWSAQQYQPADLLPYIGRGGHDNVYVGTGYGADGLVWSEVAAQLISQQILGRDNPDSALFNPRRFTPTKSAKGWLEANTKVAKHLATDHFSVQKETDFNQIETGQGKVVKVQGESYAAYRAPDGQLSLLSPICPHMKCIVHWNPGEKSWDCPCHGSRFDISGAVLEGPALEGLEPRQPPSD